VKLTGSKVQGFVSGYIAKPDPKLRAILVYGPDAGLVRERAEALAKAVAPDLDDPFRVMTLPGSALAADPARLNDEMAALSFTGGRRLVRVKDAGDALGAPFAGLLDDPPAGDSVAIAEGGDLAARSALRRAFEGAKNAVAVPCYADGARDLAELVTSVLASHKVTAAADAREYLVSRLGSDRGLSRAELEKLALYAGDGGKIGLEDAIACVGDSAALSVDDAIFAAAEGDAAALERALQRAFQEGESPVGIVKAAMRHFEKLHLAGSRIAGGMSSEAALQSLRPPIFFKHQERFLGALRQWPPRRAAMALSVLLEAERQCKRTGFPDHAICSDALLRLARGAQGKRSR
jgi:DNA polymerase III subunit delta